MIEVLSILHFGDPKRVAYLERSFGSFYKYNSRTKHIVVDGSNSISEQMPIYEKYGCKVVHMPGKTYGERLKTGVKAVGSDYFLFLPDDYAWIFEFPLEAAAEECRKKDIAELKLACRGMKWFSQENPTPRPWFTGDKVISGEKLSVSGNLYISKRRWIRDFHEQFSLGCHLLNLEFANWVVNRIPSSVRSAGEAEKRGYLALLFKRYYTAYYRMWIPAFHFIDVEIEGENNRHKALDMLIEQNYSLYNELYNK